MASSFRRILIKYYYNGRELSIPAHLKWTKDNGSVRRSMIRMPLR